MIQFITSQREIKHTGATLTNESSKEKITISKGINDMGIFMEEMNDGHYLPFEGLDVDKNPT